MKKVLFLLIITILSLATYGCMIHKETPLSTTENLDEKILNYKINKIILSKGFQTLEPNVEIVKRNNNLQLLASLGLMESSGVKIDKITKSGKEVNIYIEREFDRDKVQLAVPQIVIEVDDSIVEKLEDLNFNIINKNYENIPLKFNKSQILNKIYAHFKIGTNTIPTVELTRLKDSIFWNISFQNIFDKENLKFPLINFNVKVDARTGEILESQKDIISTSIDDGYLLDYIPNNYLLYKRQHMEKDNEYESLWIYNIDTGEKNKLYTSKDNIQSALFSPDGKYISLIEVNGEKSDIYIISKTDKIAYKITPVNYLHPKLMKWKDNNTIYFINTSDDRSTLLTYNVKESDSSFQFNLNINVGEFDIDNGKFIFVETNPDLLNKNIYLTEDGGKFKKVDTGFKATFFDSNRIIYLKNSEKDDINLLHIYNLQDSNENRILEQNIANYFRLNEENVILIEKNTCNNDYTLIKYNVLESSTKSIAKINNDKIYYDPDKERGYISLMPHFDDNMNSNIYSIDLKKLNIIEN